MMNDVESNAKQPSRRDFARAGVGLGVAGFAALGAVERVLGAEVAAPAKSVEPIIKPGDTILFQGDSITDAGRKRGIAEANSQPALGAGYAWLAASQILVDSPSADLKMFNRGISGNQIFQLAERWQKDCLDLKPNVLSILIGVNDYWRTIDSGSKRTPEDFETDYRKLLQRTKEALPDVRLILCEPFLLVAGPVEEKWLAPFEKYRLAAKKLAEEFDARFVPFQAMFDVASKVAPPATWAGDGVHPTASGAALMAHWWMKTAGA